MAIAKNSSVEFRLNALVGAVNRMSDQLIGSLTTLTNVLNIPYPGGEEQKLLIIIDRLEEIERRMATQEERLQAVGAALVGVQEGVDRIQKSLEDLKAGNPQLEDEIAAIEAQVAALGADVAEATPEPEPEPTPEG